MFKDAPQFEDAPPAQVGAAIQVAAAGTRPDNDVDSWRGNEFADRMEKCQEATGISDDVVYAYP